MRGAISRSKSFLRCGLRRFEKWRGNFRSVAGPFPVGGAPDSARLHPWFRSRAPLVAIGGGGHSDRWIPVFNPSPPSGRLVESHIFIAHTPIQVACVPHFG